MTKIQAQAIPPLLSGSDLLGAAKCVGGRAAGEVLEMAEGYVRVNLQRCCVLIH